MIIEKTGDLITEPADIIAHQTNCIGVMGAGVARQIRDRLLSKKEYSRYVEICHEKGSRLLGQTQLLTSDDGRLIANCFGEDAPSKDRLDTDYDALERSLIRVRNYAKKNRLSVAIPGLMGCGLAGGDWNVVRKMVYDIFDETQGVSLTICYLRERDLLSANSALGR